LKALECGCGKDDCAKCKCIFELTNAIDSYIPMPERAIDKPFLMAIEDVFSISGRGTVVTGRVERGVVKVGDEVEIVGLRDTQKTVATAWRCSASCWIRVRRGQHRCVAARHEEGRRGARPGAFEAGVDHPSQEVQGVGVHPDEGGGRSSHAVFQRVPSAVLLPYDGRDGRGHASEGSRW